MPSVILVEERLASACAQFSGAMRENASRWSIVAQSAAEEAEKQRGTTECRKENVMLRDGSVAVDGNWAGEGGGAGAWRDVDRQLRRAARRRARLDHDDLVLIRRGIAVQVWRPLGMVSMRDYLENVFGFGPTAASERIRVAEALDAMPALDEALAAGVLPYSAVREISRIATRATEGEWVDACRGKNLRQIEELLAEREAGDRPSSPRKPDVRLRDVRWKVKPGTYAKLRQVRQAIESACGERLDEDALVDAMCDAVLTAGARAADRARHQIVVNVCRACGMARQSAAGVDIALSPSELERAECDAERIDERGHVKQDIPPATRKLVRRRDGDRCTVPGCRSAQFIDVHHIVPRAEGGGHEPENLTLLCGAHHDAFHDRRLRIRGRAPDLMFEWTAPRPVVTGEPIDDTAVARDNFHVEERGALGPTAAMKADAALALKTLGFSRAVARAAVECACERIDGKRDLEALIRAALQCVTPGSG
jgi:5-methylcytosine-specific restriction endonuclease McrA